VNYSGLIKIELAFKILGIFFGVRHNIKAHEFEIVLFRIVNQDVTLFEIKNFWQFNLYSRYDVFQSF